MRNRSSDGDMCAINHVIVISPIDHVMVISVIDHVIWKECLGKGVMVNGDNIQTSKLMNVAGDLASGG